MTGILSNLNYVKKKSLVVHQKRIATTNFPFFNIFNKSENLKEPIVVKSEKYETLVSLHKKKESW